MTVCVVFCPQTVERVFCSGFNNLVVVFVTQCMKLYSYKVGLYMSGNRDGSTENCHITDEASRHSLQAGVIYIQFFFMKQIVLFIQGSFFDQMTKSKKKYVHIIQGSIAAHTVNNSVNVLTRNFGE
jgi:hypothetical protein